MKRILAIGAFERDNFGDLLFLRTLRDYSKDKDVIIVPASIIFSNMTTVNGEVVYPYKLMLKEFKWDIVWVVGGEVGGVDITSALIANAYDKDGVSYLRLNKSEKATYRKLLCIPDNDSNPAYLPNLQEYVKNSNTKMIINSVGLSNSALNTATLKNEIKILSDSVLSVRDIKSAEFCKVNKINCVLSPDVVSLISVFHPVPSSKSKDSYITMQSNSQLLSETNLDKLVTSLKEISDMLSANIIMLRAGVTHGHDDNVSYQEIIKRFRLLKGKHSIEEFDDRDPLQIAKLISGSKLCISTSLHCRIVSESYGVPRISLVNAKTTNYILTWKDDEYPYDIHPKDLVSTAKRIKTIIDNPIENSHHLTQKAMDNINHLFGIVDALRTDDMESNRFDEGKCQLLINYSNDQKKILDNILTDIISSRNTLREQIQKSSQQVHDLSQQVHDLSQQVHERDNVIQNVTTSKSYKVGLLMSAPYRFIRKGLGRATKNV